MMGASKAENLNAFDELIMQMKTDQAKHGGKSPSQRQSKRYRWQHQNSNFGMGM